MDVRVEATGGEDLALAGDDLGAGPITMSTRLDVRIAGLADPLDPAALEADIGLNDPPMVEDDGVGDDRVDGAVGVRACVWPMPSRMTLPPPNFTSSP